MFVVELEYTKTLADVDAHLEAHRAYLDAHYASGTFLASGPKEPRTGGVILARADSKASLMAVLAQDPFRIHGVAEYRVSEFHVQAAGTGLEQLVGA